MAARAEIRAFHPDDAEGLARDMRPMDRLEVRAMCGREVDAGLLREMGTGAFTATWDGTPIAVLGIHRATVIATTGAPWMLCTTAVSDPILRRRMARASAPVLDELSRGYRRLVNYVARDNAEVIRWLEWLGFDVARHNAITVRGVEFCQFAKDV